MRGKLRAFALVLLAALVLLTGCSLPAVVQEIAEIAELPLAETVPEAEKTVPETEAGQLHHEEGSAGPRVGQYPQLRERRCARQEYRRRPFRKL